MLVAVLLLFLYPTIQAYHFCLRSKQTSIEMKNDICAFGQWMRMLH